MNNWSSWKGTHYGMNYFVGYKTNTWGDATARIYRKVSSIYQPSKVFYIMDKGPGVDSQSGAIRIATHYVRASYKTIALRHEKSFNVTMIDGHVENQKQCPLFGIGKDWKDTAWGWGIVSPPYNDSDQR